MEQLEWLLSALSGWLGSKRRFDPLPSLVFCVRLLTIEVERFQHGRIRKRKQDSALVTQTVGMIMPHPRRETKDISRLPIETLSVHHRPTSTFDDMVDDASRMTMRLRLLAWPQHLNPAIDGRHHRTAREGIRVLQRYAVVGAPIPVGELGQPIFRLRPAKVEQWRIFVSAPFTNRQEPSRTVAPNRLIPRHGDWLTAIRAWIIFLKRSPQSLDQRHVETVQPDHRLIVF